MKHYCLFFILSFFLFLSCNKEELQEVQKAQKVQTGIQQGQESGSEINACGVTQPQKNLSWLAELIAKAKTDNTGNYRGLIWLEQYKGQDVFVTNMSLGSGGIAYHVFDCQGSPLTIESAETEEFFKNLKFKTVVFAPSDYPQ
jgi:hypothetical protein